MDDTNMQDSDAICPYPGLRPFTEEESLYFKGREDQVAKITGLLEEKKFLMVTGASGDGKSSLIYGGLIPQARAGFFKASYSRWAISAFRPERSPMENMTRALAEQLGSDVSTTGVELSRGFSSLIDLYKASDLYLDHQSLSWQKAGEDEHSEMERKAANLLIIIDQFEEFFTNPENFAQGIPSQDARLLLNIILETVKVSLREDLPVYVVCTMRSDYIGQCAAFRGLPEFIGFSQFFVPRLQRRELQQVIEEPAILSGNRISKRLTDRLIFDIEEGLDQLPILQHALKQIWKAADKGREEMDLIHYAMVGGMNGEKLPKEDIGRFNSWKKGLAGYELGYLQLTGLSRVLDIHANKLYEEAAEIYNSTAAVPVTNKDAKLIIGLAFSCLTRIDENRPVRNRMTLEEITGIINVPAFSTEVVSGVLSIFRAPENTLIRPFIDPSDTGPDNSLEPGTVLDITHEALIRNWQLLKKWSATEFEYHSVFLDLKQQMDRWIENGRSSDYLLPVGPLNYFENWYKQCRPNKFWINRYNQDEAKPSEKLEKSRSVLSDMQKFLRKSALNIMVTRTVMKYGAMKILGIAAIIVLLGLGVFLLHSLHIRRNNVVIATLIRDGQSLLKEKSIASDYKADFILTSSRLNQGGTSAISGQASDDQDRINVALKIFEKIYFVNRESNPPIKIRTLLYADSLVHQSDPPVAFTDGKSLNSYLNNLNDLIRDESYYQESGDNENIRMHLNNNLNLLRTTLVHILNFPSPPRGMDMKAINIGIENILNLKGLDAEQIKALVSSVSPFENTEAASRKFNLLFPAAAKINVGIAQSVLSHNGGYEKLAYMYAALGEVTKVICCLDSLNRYNDNYNQLWNNSSNIAGYFLMYGHDQAFRDFVVKYSGKIGVPGHVFVKWVANQAGIIVIGRARKFVQHGNYNENLALFDHDLVKKLFSIYESTLKEEIKDKNELNFNLALQNKHEGAVIDRISLERHAERNTNEVDSLFSVANEYYLKVPEQFLEKRVEVYTEPALGNKEKGIMERRHLFLYPDNLKLDEASLGSSAFRYYGDAYFRYMVRHNLFSKYYHSQEDYQLLITWINSYFEMYGILAETGYWNRSAVNYPDLAVETISSMDSVILNSGFSDQLDDAWIRLSLARHYFAANDTSEAFDNVKKLKFLVFNKPFNTEGSPFQNMKMIIADQLAVNGKRNEAVKIIGQFSNIKNRVVGYGGLALFTKKNDLSSESEVYLDSALKSLNGVKFYRFNRGDLGLDYRTGLASVLMIKDKSSTLRFARELIKSMEFESKLNGLLASLRTLTYMRKDFDAMSSIPDMANPEDRLRCITSILRADVLQRPDQGNNSWNSYDRDLKGWLNYTEFLYDLYEY